MSSSDLKQPLSLAVSLLRGRNDDLSRSADKVRLGLRAGRISQSDAKTILDVAGELRSQASPGWPLFHKTAKSLEDGLSQTNRRG
jgi:hypothetical protein